MSDIGIDLSGLIALIVFLAAAAGLVICGLICGVVAVVRRRGTAGGIKAQPAFVYSVVAVLLVLVNLIAFAIVLAVVDDIDKSLAARLDNIAMFAWLPVQPIVWLGTAFLFNRSRRKQ
jgi:hypothetical protein